MASNVLIGMLPPPERGGLLAACEPVELRFGERLQAAGRRTTHVYFPVEPSFISLVATAGRTPSLELGLIGSEGMLGVQLALGVQRAPMNALVQGAGPALRMEAEAFTTELAGNEPLREALQRYVYVLMAELSRSAICVHEHQVGKRLAKWLLLTADRANAPAFKLTQEFMGYMLGVRRVGISAAATTLREDGVIEYSRGVVRILDRSRLEAAACGCYVQDGATYKATMNHKPH